MKKLSLLAIISLVASPAMAADLPNRAAPPVFVPPVSPATWAGCYVGGLGAVDIARVDDRPSDFRSNRFKQVGPFVGPIPQGGGVNAFVRTTTITNASARNTTPYGQTFVGGDGAARAGCNYQTGQLVLGAQLEAGYLGINGTTADPRRLTTASSIGGGFYAAVTGRIGYAAFERTLLYVRGGVGYADLKYSTYDPLFRFNTSAQGSQAIPLVGAGIEYKLTPQISLTGEYTYLRPGCRTLNYTIGIGSGGGSSTTCVDKHTVALGLNYYFIANAPVVARY